MKLLIKPLKIIVNRNNDVYFTKSAINKNTCTTILNQKLSSLTSNINNKNHIFSNDNNHKTFQFLQIRKNYSQSSKLLFDKIILNFFSFKFFKNNVSTLARLQKYNYSTFKEAQKISKTQNKESQSQSKVITSQQLVQKQENFNNKNQNTSTKEHNQNFFKFIGIGGTLGVLITSIFFYIKEINLQEVQKHLVNITGQISTNFQQSSKSFKTSVLDLTTQIDSITGKINTMKTKLVQTPQQVIYLGFLFCIIFTIQMMVIIIMLYKGRR